MKLLEKVGLTVPEGMEDNEELKALVEDTHALWGMVQRRLKELEDLSSQYGEKYRMLVQVGDEFQATYDRACAALDKAAPGHRDAVCEENLPKAEMEKIQNAAEKQFKQEQEARKKVEETTKQVIETFGHLGGAVSRLATMGVNPMMALFGGGGRAGPGAGFGGFGFGQMSGPPQAGPAPGTVEGARPLPADHPIHALLKKGEGSTS